MVAPYLIDLYTRLSTSHCEFLLKGVRPTAVHLRRLIPCSAHSWLCLPFQTPVSRFSIICLLYLNVTHLSNRVFVNDPISLHVGYKLDVGCSSRSPSHHPLFQSFSKCYVFLYSLDRRRPGKRSKVVTDSSLIHVI